MADDNIDVGINVHGDGAEEAKQLAEAIKSLRKELQALFALQVSPEAKAAAKQAADELAASARSIAAQKKDAAERAKAIAQQSKDELAASARQLAADRATYLQKLREFNKLVAAENKRARDQERSEVSAERTKQRADAKQRRDELAASARQISADRKAAADRERAEARQSRDELRASARQIAADRRAAAATSARGAGGPGDPNVTKGILDQAAALKQLAAAVISAAAAFAGFQGFRAFIEEGLEFNKIIETANLGIASLITAQTKMTDSSGKSVEGIDKLRVAQALATVQIQKLRIAGLQTAATTEQLSIAFQQAVGVGLRWGLTLDQIRTITIQVSQAALGLGVPLNQLNEEIRSLLTGTITPRNTRIATALGITNQMIRQAQQAGTLFEVVTKRLEAFTIAGEATQKTFVGILSNLREALQNLAGDAVKPLFDDLKIIGQATLEEIFDMKHARISDKFSGILDVARSVFGELGGMLADAIGVAVQGAEALNGWLKENQLQLTAIWESVKLIGAEVGSILHDVIALIVPLGEATVQAGLLSTILNGVGLVVAAIHVAFQAVVSLLGDIGATILTGVITPMIGWLRISARIVRIFDEDMAQAIDNSATAGEEFLKDITKGVADYTTSLLHGEDALTKFINKMVDGQDKAQRTAIAQQELNDTLRDVVTSEENQTDVLDKRLRAGTIKQKDYADAVNKIQIESVQRQIAAQQKYFNFLDSSDDRDRRHTLSIIKELKNREAALKKNVTLKSIAEPAPADDSAVKREQAANILIKEALQERLKDLKIMLDNQAVSYEEYYNGIVQANLEALDKQIEAQKQLLTKTTDLGAREKIKAQILAFENEKNQIIEDNDEKRRQAEIKLGEEITAIHVQVLKDEGRLSEARALEIGDKFKKLIAQLKKEGRPEDVSLVERLLGIETAKTRLDELMRHANEVQQTLSTRLNAISAEQEANAINEREARDEIVKAYRAAEVELQKLIPEMRQMAAATGDPTAIDNVEQLNTKLLQMSTTVKRIADDFFKLKATLKDASTSAIADIFTNLPGLPFQDRTQINALKDQLGGAQKELARLLKGPQTAEAQTRITQLREEIAKVTVELHDSEDEIKTWRDVLVDAARSIVSALQRVVSEMLATLIIQKAMTFLGGFSGGGSVNATMSGGDLSGRVPVASGGFIRGPGTATSDSIPAWLSDGEFVVRSAAVKSVGVDLLQEINAQGNTSPRLRRRRGFADGGVVSQARAAESRLSATLGLEEGLVLRHLESDAGTKAMLTVLARNRRTVNAVLRGQA